MTQRNLLTLIRITCLCCYDFGWIIDRFDHGKRETCHCQQVSDEGSGKHIYKVDSIKND